MEYVWNEVSKVCNRVSSFPGLNDANSNSWLNVRIWTTLSSSCRRICGLDLHVLQSHEFFYCCHGKAYLFDQVVNVTVVEKDKRMMMTGLHTVVRLILRCMWIHCWMEYYNNVSVQHYY